MHHKDLTYVFSSIRSEDRELAFHPNMKLQCNIGWKMSKWELKKGDEEEEIP